MTAEFYKKVYQNTYLNDVRLKVLGQENIRKISNWMETDVKTQSPF